MASNTLAVEIRVTDAEDVRRILDDATRDTARLRWLMECFDGLTGVYLDRYDYAMQVADERGNDEPDDEDHFDGFLRMVDAAMAAAGEIEPDAQTGEG